MADYKKQLLDIAPGMIGDLLPNLSHRTVRSNLSRLIRASGQAWLDDPEMFWVLLAKIFYEASSLAPGQLGAMMGTSPKKAIGLINLDLKSKQRIIRDALRQQDEQRVAYIVVGENPSKGRAVQDFTRFLRRGSDLMGALADAGGQARLGAVEAESSGLAVGRDAIGGVTSRGPEPPRRVNIWIVDPGSLPLEVGTTYKIGLNVGQPRSGALSSARFNEPEWKGDEAVSLTVILSGDGVQILPRLRRFNVFPTGDTGPVYYDIIPQRRDGFLLRVSIYLTREMELLQEFECPVEMLDAARAA
jgi:hypothetical protein